MNTLSKIQLAVVISLVLVLVTSFCLLVGTNQRVTLGSNTVGNDYYATTTDATWGAYAGGKLVKSGTGSLGSVIVTLTSNGTLELYDATTTTNHSDHATTSLGLFRTTTAGTYVFDVEFKRGLVVVMNNTVGVASTTVTWR
jgi:hypothetical protein